MTKRKRTEIIVAAVLGALVVASVSAGLFLLLPRRLLSVAGMGTPQNVTAIVYKTSPCCGYMEGPEFEATLTDEAAIGRVLARLADDKMKWTFPVMRAGGSDSEVTFRSAKGETTVKFEQGQLGNYRFTERQNVLAALAAEVARPYIYLSESRNVPMDADFLVLDTYAEFQSFAAAQAGYDGTREDYDDAFFQSKKLVAVNLGEGSSSRQFFLIKLTQNEGGYALKIADMQRGPAADDTVPMAALISLPKAFDVSVLTFDIERK